MSAGGDDGGPPPVEGVVVVVVVVGGSVVVVTVVVVGGSVVVLAVVVVVVGGSVVVVTVVVLVVVVVDGGLQCQRLAGRSITVPDTVGPRWVHSGHAHAGVVPALPYISLATTTSECGGLVAAPKTRAPLDTLLVSTVPATRRRLIPSLKRRPTWPVASENLGETGPGAAAELLTG